MTTTEVRTATMELSAVPSLPDDWHETSGIRFEWMTTTAEDGTITMLRRFVSDWEATTNNP